jgi:hypothetical protein
MKEPHPCTLGTEQYVCCASMANQGSQNAARRLCGLGPGNPCGSEGSMGGCAVCWFTTWNTSCSVSTIGWGSFRCTDDTTVYAGATELLSISTQ